MQVLFLHQKKSQFFFSSIILGFGIEEFNLWTHVVQGQGTCVSHLGKKLALELSFHPKCLVNSCGTRRMWRTGKQSCGGKQEAEY